MTLLLTMTVGLWAQNTTQRLVVWQKNGEKVYFDLAEEPKTTFRGGLLIITTNLLETSYQLSNIQRYTHEGVDMDIDAIASTSRDLMVSQSKAGVILRNVPKGTPVRLYDPAGRLLETKTSNGASSIQFSLEGRPHGVYIVNMNDQTFKITKR